MNKYTLIFGYKKMKKVLGFIISLIMIFGMVGCLDNTNPLPIIPDSSNSETNPDKNSKDDSPSDSSTEIEDSESSENDENSGGNDDSSSNGNEDKPSHKTEGWTGFY